ncbi:uncharacterized protein LOC126747735 [Anthonomus grandis grandis]|uniref:uncharacterized protein LOC126747735 n=1 Tax=Anthonomus grandis grandis TaxID=2921223 RepID=UPI00216641A0|nr:uncharacterized protein LOC126747735 [Anthonomus grandis grandis]
MENNPVKPTIVDLSESKDQTDEDIKHITKTSIKIPCIKCNQVFPMDEFPSHQATHKLTPRPPLNQEIKCTECGMDFDTVENLINHMKALHFSMWGSWGQYYNWNQVYSYPYGFDYAGGSSEASYGTCRRWADPPEPPHRHRHGRRSPSPPHRRGRPPPHHRGWHGRFHRHHHHRGRSLGRRRRFSSSSSSSSSNESYDRKNKGGGGSPIVLLDSDEEGRVVDLVQSADEGEWVVADSWVNEN